MNYNDFNKELFNDFLKYKKKIALKIEDKRIFMTEDCYLLFIKKLKERLYNWLESIKFISEKDRYMKLMNNLLKWIKK